MMIDPIKEGSVEGGARADRRAGEQGWALLGLLLALTILSMVLASAITPNVAGQVQRSKEDEMIYRGNKIARAIAIYYNGGKVLGPINPLALTQVRYGKLTELKKLRDGFTIGVQEVKLIRPSEMIDPMTSQEWEPVRVRDPRLNKVLQAWSAENGAPISPMYSLLAGPQAKLKLANPSGDGDQQKPGADGRAPGGGDPQDPNDVDPELPDDHDPLSQIPGLGLSDGLSTTESPIIGVAPKARGTAMRPLYGLDSYEDWVFIFIPLTQTGNGSLLIPPNGNNANSNRNRVSP
jgi:hypothetical protein